MDVKREIIQLLAEMGAGTQISASAYDTAWLARLKPVDENLASHALTWLRGNQLPDGSWGNARPLYYHERVICTLSAMIALSSYGEKSDKDRIIRAHRALEIFWRGLKNDLSGETIAFEMILPTLLEEANRYNLYFRFEKEFLQKHRRIREYKLAKAPQSMINRQVTMAHSAEMLGDDGLRLLDLDNLQEPNGSVGHSPAATAYYLLQTGGNAHALTYLNQAMHAGSVPPVTPIDVFERGWVLWNLTLTPEWLEKALFASIQPHLEFLDSFWHPTQGIGFASAYEAKDADGTSVVQSVLSHFGRPKQIETVLFYEEATYFRCFSLEANYSTSANIHVLDALMRAGLDPAHPSVRKVVQFLSKEQHSAGFWRDKWHASPYYTTSHAMIALAPLAHPGIQGAIQWMLSTQNKKGGWGFYLPTAEETAYCVQALIWCYKMGFAVPQEAIQRGATWLRGHRTPPYPPLWIGKCLYAPVNVIRSTILSALMLAESL